MKKLIAVMSAFILLVSLTSCGESKKDDSAKAPDIELTEIKETSIVSPTVIFGIPTDGSFKEVETDDDTRNGITVQKGDFNIYFGFTHQSHYVDGSSESATFEEMRKYREEKSMEKIADITLAGMNGFSQDSESGKIIYYFPVDESMLRNTDYPEVLEIFISYNVYDENGMRMSVDFEEARNKLYAFLEEPTTKAILESVKVEKWEG